MIGKVLQSHVADYQSLLDFVMRESAFIVDETLQNFDIDYPFGTLFLDEKYQFDIGVVQK